MNLKENVQKILEDGSWVINDLEVLFLKKLQKHFNINPSSKKNLTELCLSYYSKKNPSDLKFNPVQKGLEKVEMNSTTVELISKIINRDNPKASIINFENEISRKLSAALVFINLTNNNIFELVSNSLVSFLRVSGGTFRSASHPHLYGTILIGDAILDLNAEDSAVSIIHEIAHQELFLLNMIDRLVNEEYDLNEIHSDFQGKPRPPIGRLHSLWALYRMTGFERLFRSRSLKYKDVLSQNINAFSAGELTPFGKNLVKLVRLRN